MLLQKNVIEKHDTKNYFHKNFPYEFISKWEKYVYFFHS